MPRLPASSLARWAAYIAVLVGVLLIFRGFQTLSSTPLPFAISLMIIGALQMLLSFHVLQRNRAGWAFLTSLNGTLFVVGLFGAPKLRDTLEIHLALALIPCLAFGAVCLLAALAAEDFER